MYPMGSNGAAPRRSSTHRRWPSRWRSDRRRHCWRTKPNDDHRPGARALNRLGGPEQSPWSGKRRAVTLSYERARGLRAVGQQTDGFAITVSRTVHVPTERLFDAFSDETVRQNWLPDGELRQRTATRPRSSRSPTPRLADADQAEQQKLFWRERLTTLKSIARGRCAVTDVNVVAVLASAIARSSPGTGAMIYEGTPAKLASIHAGDWLAKLLIIAPIVSTWQ